MMDSEMKDVIILDGCRMIEVDIHQSKVDEDTDEVAVSIQSNFQVSLQEDATNHQCGMDVIYSFESKDASFYSGSVRLRGLFNFPEYYTAESREKYLMSEGVLRIYDILRQYIATVTANGAFGPFELPPFGDRLLPVV